MIRPAAGPLRGCRSPRRPCTQQPERAPLDYNRRHYMPGGLFSLPASAATTVDLSATGSPQATILFDHLVIFGSAASIRNRALGLLALTWLPSLALVRPPRFKGRFKSSQTKPAEQCRLDGKHRPAESLRPVTPS